MRSALELHDSRVIHIEWVGGDVVIRFSHAYIHKSKGTPGKDPGTGWSQEARLVMHGASSEALLPPVPNTISEGYLEVGGIKHALIPLPFKRKVGATLCLEFVDGTRAEVVGDKPFVELFGAPMYLEEF
jgi:hypothetical protein